MGLIQKKEQKDEIDGIEIIERSDAPNDLPQNDVELVAGTSAEHIAAGTTAEEEAERAEAEIIESAADENLMPEGAEDDSEQDSDDKKDEEDAKPRTADEILADIKRKRTVFCAVAAALVIVAAIAGYFVGNGGFGGKGTGTAALSEDQLESTVATYSYNGKSVDITAREAIESQYSVDNVKDDDGNYTAPSAETILSYVRTQILIQQAEKEGITVSAKEMKKVAKTAIGTSNYKTMAKQYGLTVKQAKKQVKEYALRQKLYKKVVKNSSLTAPTAPTEPADENNLTDDEKATYAQYIIDLAGSKWNSKKNTWKSSKSTYAQQVGDFDGQSATYEQAQSAYYVAYQEYSTKASAASTKWTNYENELFANANIHVYGLFA